MGHKEMITFSFPSEIYLAIKPTDFRKCFDGLCGEVHSQFQNNPLTGALFVFYNKRKDRLKMLVWDTDGFWLLYKRLEQGTFEIPKASSDNTTVTLTHQQLQLILYGIELSSIRKRKRFDRPFYCQAKSVP
jgi:transposase